MRMKEVKQGLVSIGLGILISVPICHGAVESWEKSPQVTFETLPEDVSWSHETITNKAHEIYEAQKKRQELIDAEHERQEQIEREAEYVLEVYDVEVPEDIRLYCEQAQEESNVCAELLEAVAWRESRYDASAENGGCSGIMQISTKWHRDRMTELGVTDIYDAEGNIRVGADYLAELFEKHDGDTYKVLMEYNGDTSEGVSDYAIEITEVSAALERVHGK